MDPRIVYLIDEDDVARRAVGSALQRLLDPAPVEIKAIVPKLPIYILTAFANEEGEFEGSEFNVEAILDKSEIEDPTSETAKIIKARFLRRLAVFEDVLSIREKRFHQLLIKSLKESLS